MANFTEKKYLDLAGVGTLVNKIKAEDQKIKDLIGTVESGKTVVDMISAGAYDDTKVKADIVTAQNTANTANTAAANAQTTADAANTLAGQANTAAGAAQTTADAANTLAGQANTAAAGAQADATEALTKINTFMAAADVSESAVDTLKEIQDYITGEGQAAAALAAKVDTNTTAITGLQTTISNLDAEVSSTAPTAGEGIQVTVTQEDGKITAVAVSGDYSELYDAKGDAAAVYNAMKVIETSEIEALFQ